MAILFIDDDETGRAVAGFNLRKAGIEVDEATDGIEGLATFDPERHEVVVTDLKMPNADGMTVLATLQKKAPEVPVVVITAFGTIDKAVEAMRAGAWDFVEKPFSRDRLELTLRRALETSRLRRAHRSLVAERVERPIVAESAGMKQVVALTDRVANSDVSVLVTGESGVGKELIARRLHARSPRAAEPFVAVSCAAIPQSLLASELFGHSKGAFTGASRARQGRFRAASGGTLFLDEVGELPFDVQGSLLRVLQEGVVDVVGDDTPVAVDVRLVAATNRDLDQAVANGTFREDLYYRLNVIQLVVPPLRDRLDDLPPLVRAFIQELSDGRELEVPDDVVSALLQRRWPGNVRQLRNVCERLALLTPTDRVRTQDLPQARPHQAGSWLDHLPDELGLFDLERQVIVHTLQRLHGNVSGAARSLGVPRHILAYRIEKHGIDLAD